MAANPEAEEMADEGSGSGILGAAAVAGGALAAGAAAAHFMKGDEEGAETPASEALAAEEAEAAAAPPESAADAREAMAPGLAEGMAAGAALAAGEHEPSRAEEAAAPEPDDLRQLPDVGPVYERMLHGRGLMTYAQIAALNWEDVQSVFTGDDPESGYPVIPVTQEGAEAIIDAARRLEEARKG